MSTSEWRENAAIELSLTIKPRNYQNSNCEATLKWKANLLLRRQEITSDSILVPSWCKFRLQQVDTKHKWARAEGRSAVANTPATPEDNYVKTKKSKANANNIGNDIPVCGITDEKRWIYSREFIFPLITKQLTFTKKSESRSLLIVIWIRVREEEEKSSTNPFLTD